MFRGNIGESKKHSSAARCICFYFSLHAQEYKRSGSYQTATPSYLYQPDQEFPFQTLLYSTAAPISFGINSWRSRLLDGFGVSSLPLSEVISTEKALSLTGVFAIVCAMVLLVAAYLPTLL